MRKILICFCILGVLALSSMVNAAAPTVFEKYWEKLCGVKTSVDDVRTMALWRQGALFVTIDRQSGSQAIPIYNLNSGQRWIKQDYVAMSGSEASIPVANYNIVDGDFTDDGKLVVCSLSYSSGAPLKVFIWDTLTTGPRIIYSSGAAWRGYRLGDAVDVAGSTADNSAVILITGNSATALPMKFTTADNGRTWTPTDFANIVKAQEIEQVTPGGDFWATCYSLSAPIQKYNSAGVSYGAGGGNQIPNGGVAFGAFALDAAYDRIYTMGIRTDSLATNYLSVYQLSTGTKITDLSSDPIDALGSCGTTANGSSSCELLVTPGGGHFIYALSERNGCARYSYSTNLIVDKVGATHGKFANLQTAIDQCCLGQTFDPAVTTTVTLPLIITLDQTQSPFEESLTLDDAKVAAPRGNIQGDIVIKGSDEVNLTNVRLQRGAGATDDGIMVHQNIKGVIFKNIVFTPSLLGLRVTDDLFKCDENSANTTMNWLEWWNCILTDIDAAGTPFTMTKAGAFVTPPARAAGGMVDGADTAMKIWNDAGESLSRVNDNVTFYGWAGYAANYMCQGIDGEQVYINNCLYTYGGWYATRWDSSNVATKYYRVSGTDSGAGPLNCSAYIQNAGHGMYITGGASGVGADGVAKIDNVLIYTNLTTNSPRGISGSGWVDTQIRDTIIETPFFPIVDGITNYAWNPAIYERLTIHNSTSNNAIYIASGTQTLTLKDCVFSGAGTKIADASAGGAVIVNASNCAFVLDGPDKIGAVGNVDSNLNSVRFDPVYANKTDATLANFMDVRSQLYAGKGTAGANLAGGADYIGDATPPTVDAVPASWDFGSLNVGDAATTETFIVTNNGGQTLYVYSTTVSGSADFSINKALAASIAAGTSDTLKVLYTPNTMGLQTANVQIACNIAASPKLIPVQGTGLAPEIDVTGAPVVFGTKILGGASEDKTFTITNVGNKNLTVYNIVKTGSASIYFKAPAPSFPMTITPSNSEVITITYNPDNPGPQTANFAITSDDSDESLVNVIASGVTIGASYQLVSDPDAYTSGCLALDECPNDCITTGIADLIEGVTGIVESGGWHSAYSGGAAPVTNGVFDTNNVTALANDYGYSSPSLVLRWDNLHNATIDKIIVFSGHDGNGTRAFIDCKIEVKQGGMWNLVGYLTTGSFGQLNPAKPTVAYAKFEAPGLASGVDGIKFSFYCVASSFVVPYQFEMPGANAIEGTIIKEIDVCGENYTRVDDWRLIR